MASESNGEISVEERGRGVKGREKTSRNLDPRMHCARSRRLAVSPWIRDRRIEPRDEKKKEGGV